MRQESHSHSLELSVIIPAHDEAARILPTLRSIVDYMESRSRTCEIIVVDDGSVDDTARIVYAATRETPLIRVVRLPACVGKGAAVRHGMQRARGRRHLFTDADGATPITELDRLEQALAGGASIAIGSRSEASRRPGFRVQARWHRSVLGAVFNALVRLGGIAGIKDTQCGFKLFERSVSADLFSVSCINGYGFDLELLFVAQQRGYRVAEVPVNWVDQPGSKVHLFRDGLAMLRELWTIRRNAARGVYSDRLVISPLSPAPSSAPLLE
ncbi:MAG: glycosyltransferase family 2 protein [Nitrospiraceae bacterium]|nr:glycosyltransferase family 2 protein [Nitrospiraceae bacterium]